MTADAHDLAALIGSRLCHDLVSPLGAIGNGLELLRMTQPSSPELDLVEEAVKVAQARVRLFRVAFGAASQDQTIRGRELTEALNALSANGRITVACDVPDALPRIAARRLCLAALCAETAMAWGGTITVEVDGLRAEAARLKLDDGLWHSLAQSQVPEDISSATVHFALLAESGPVTLDLGETGLTIKI